MHFKGGVNGHPHSYFGWDCSMCSRIRHPKIGGTIVKAARNGIICWVCYIEAFFSVRLTAKWYSTVPPPKRGFKVFEAEYDKLGGFSYL